MAKATLKERIRSIRQKSDAAPLRRFLDAPARQTAPAERTVQPGSVNIEARTLSAVVATNASRLLEIWDDDLCRDVIVEEIVLVEGMDLSRVDTGMQFLDNHNVWELEANLGRVTAARLDEVEGSGPSIVVDIQMSSRPDLDWMITDLANDVLGCISCQYRPIESTLEQRDGQYPLLTHTKSELLEVSLVSVPADPHASVRSETSLKGQNMTPKPKSGVSATAMRAAAAALKRNDAGAGGDANKIDDAAIAEIVDAVIAEVVPAVVDEVTAAVAGDDAGKEQTEEEKAAAAEAEKKAAEDAAKAAGGASTDIRSMIRTAVQAKLGTRSAVQPSGDAAADAEMKHLEGLADKYGCRSQFNDMKTARMPFAELRSFVGNFTASRSGTGQTHDGRNAAGQSELPTFATSFRGKRAAERAQRR